MSMMAAVRILGIERGLRVLFSLALLLSTACIVRAEGAIGVVTDAAKEVSFLNDKQLLALVAIVAVIGLVATQWLREQAITKLSDQISTIKEDTRLILEACRRCGR